MKDIGFQVKERGQSHPRKLTGENLLMTVILSSLGWGSHCFLEPQMWSALIGVFLICFFYVSTLSLLRKGIGWTWLRSDKSQVTKVKNQTQSSQHHTEKCLMCLLLSRSFLCWWWSSYGDHPKHLLINKAKCIRPNTSVSVSALSLTGTIRANGGCFSLEWGILWVVSEVQKWDEVGQRLRLWVEKHMTRVLKWLLRSKLFILIRG